MKTGILTFHNSRNYGAMLQAFALKTTLNDMGFDSHIVNFSYQSSKPPMNLKRRLLAIKRYPYKKDNDKMAQAFNDFNRNVIKPDDGECLYAGQIPEYDAFICGSDQVWNPKITNGVCREFFADINDKALRISYAASAGSVDEIKSSAVQVRHFTEMMDAVSVREKPLKEYIESICDKDVALVIDPSLLQNSATYEKIASAPIIDKKYVLIYNKAGKKDKTYKLGRRIAKLHNALPVEITAEKGKVNFSVPGYKRLGGVGPAEFLSLIKNSEAVVTDSFHGVAFSVIFKKEFYSIPSRRAERMNNLLESLGLSDRITNENVKEATAVDYSKVEPLLNAERENARKFLSEALSMKHIEKEPKNYYQSGKAEDCTGCGACADACPTSAITMIADNKGFIYPKIDIEKCIDCSKCERTCPSTGKLYKSEKPLKAMVVHNKNEAEIASSTSSGVMSSLSSAFIKNGGVVFGAVYDENYTVRMDYAENEEQLYRFKKSKYAQSAPDNYYKKVEKFLKDGREVLFCGLSCQIAGLKSYLSKEYDNLYTCSLFCGGVCSPSVFEDFKKALETEAGDKLETFDFRHRSHGNSHSYAEFKNGVVYDANPLVCSYKKMFDRRAIVRESCNVCQYATYERVSDMSVGDVIKPKNINAVSLKSSSSVFVSSQKGEKMWKLINNYFESQETDFFNLMQTGIDTRRFVSCNTDNFYKFYEENGYMKSAEKYGGNTKNANTKYKLKKMIKKA